MVAKTAWVTSGLLVVLGEYGDGPNAQFGRGVNDSNCNFATISDQ